LSDILHLSYDDADGRIMEEMVDGLSRVPGMVVFAVIGSCVVFGEFMY